ncbi:MAG: hypothetical protein H0T42_26885 [Deltaproteobacteria bacterium]|nr:hypothetical protein [Deltaproteobacteria bacterium]
MRKFLIAALSLAMFTGVAAADRGGRGRGHDNRSNVRDHRNNNHQKQRVNRPARRADRRAVVRQPVYATDGRYVFSSGVTRVYTRPTIRTRYYNANVRPRLVVENYRAEPGYIWVRGGWTWVGSEWQWGGGHYAPDPQYHTYYDDGSYDYSPPTVKASIGIRIGG